MESHLQEGVRATRRVVTGNDDHGQPLALDTQEVHLKAGDMVIQRGTNHAWGSGSDTSCVIAISSHDGAF